MIIIKIKTLKNGKIPTKSTKESAGFDLYAAIEKEIEIKPAERILIPTGFCLDMPSSFYCQICPRSGLALNHGITVLNAPAIIDSDFTGEIKVILINLSKNSFIIKPEMRIAQLIFLKYNNINFKNTITLKETERGIKGFGSTGI